MGVKKNNFSCDNLPADTMHKLQSLKQEKTNKEFLQFLIDNHIELSKETLEQLEELKSRTNSSVNELLLPFIEKHIEKTLKKLGKSKEKHKSSIEAENKLYNILHEMVEYYEGLPAKDKKFISMTMVTKYILKNDKPTVHMNVIKRVFARGVDFVDAYHAKNNLTIESNLKRK